jgi:hypothetical protein
MPTYLEFAALMGGVGLLCLGVSILTFTIVLVMSPDPAMTNWSYRGAKRT